MRFRVNADHTARRCYRHRTTSIQTEYKWGSERAWTSEGVTVQVAWFDHSTRARGLMMHVFYLHGFMSSPNSSKAQFLADRLRRHGIHLECPDLNEPDFATLTISRMIAQVKSKIRSLSADSVVLMGSSLGASVALHLAENMDCSGPSENEFLVDRLILLAPALDVGQRRFGDVDEQGMKRWLASGWLELMHHAYGELRGLRYEFYDDARRYSSSSIRQKVPTLILQGDRDTVVDPESVANFAAQRPHVQLVRLDDDHQLTNSLTQVWTETEKFLGLRSD